MSSAGYSIPLPFPVNPFSGEELGRGRCVSSILWFPADQLSPACTSKAILAQVGVLTRTEPSDDRKSKAFVGLCDWGKSAHLSFFCSPPACLEKVLCDNFQPLWSSQD